MFRSQRFLAAYCTTVGAPQPQALGERSGRWARKAIAQPHVGLFEPVLTER